MGALLNGRTLFLGENYKSGHIHSTKNIVIMAKPIPGGGFGRSFFGKITDVNIWSREFSEEDSQAWTNCEVMEGGDIVDWRRATWEARELEVVQLNREEVCNQRAFKGNRVLDIKMSFLDTWHLVGVLGGEMAMPNSNVSSRTFQNVFNSSTKLRETCGENFFTGFTDGEEEGKFVNVMTGEPLTWDN